MNDSNGSSVVTINTSQFKVNPDLPVAEKLQQWDITEGQNTAFISLSPELSNMSRNYVLETIARIKDEKVGRSDKPDFITVRVVLSHVRADICCYLLCSLELTGKRCYIEVTRNGDGTWYCDSCNQRTINLESRCLLLFQIKDHTGSTSFTAGASTDNIYILRALCTDHGLYSDKQLQQFPWDPGGSILLHRLGGKPKLKKGGMLGISYGWAFTWAMGLRQSSHAWMGDYKCKGQERDNPSNNYQTNQYRYQVANNLVRRSPDAATPVRQRFHVTTFHHRTDAAGTVRQWPYSPGEQI